MGRREFWTVDIDMPKGADQLGLNDRWMLLLHAAMRMYLIYPDCEQFELDKSDVYAMIGEYRQLRWDTISQKYEGWLTVGLMPNDKFLISIPKEKWDRKSLIQWKIRDRVTFYLYRKVRGGLPIMKYDRSFRDYDLAVDLLKLIDLKNDK